MKCVDLQHLSHPRMYKQTFKETGEKEKISTTGLDIKQSAKRID